MGLPTPNLFAGEHNFHSRLEWVSAQDLERAVAVIVELAGSGRRRRRGCPPGSVLCVGEGLVPSLAPKGREQPGA